MKNFLIAIACCISFSSFACPNAQPTNDVNFCPTFKTAATCYCTSSGLPAGMCQDMRALYARMMVFFGSLKKACERQNYTTTQECMDNWTCYLDGGVDSQNRACSSNQRSCQ